MGVREYVLASSAEEAASLVGEPGTALMGGGTLLMPLATAGTLGAEHVPGPRRRLRARRTLTGEFYETLD
jgi:hypothetical protein